MNAIISYEISLVIMFNNEEIYFSKISLKVENKNSD